MKIRHLGLAASAEMWAIITAAFVVGDGLIGFLGGCHRVRELQRKAWAYM